MSKNEESKWFDLNKAGPITKTNRKRLVSTNEHLELSSNDDWPTEPLVKTRKVKSKPVVSQKPIKKKRAVKKTIENTEPKLVDEKKLMKISCRMIWLRISSQMTDYHASVIRFSILHADDKNDSRPTISSASIRLITSPKYLSSLVISCEDFFGNLYYLISYFRISFELN